MSGLGGKRTFAGQRPADRDAEAVRVRLDRAEYRRECGGIEETAGSIDSRVVRAVEREAG